MTKDTIYIGIDEIKTKSPVFNTEKVFVFDVDETLYSFDCKMQDLLAILPVECIRNKKILQNTDDIYTEYSKKYGIALRGYIADKLITPDEYIDAIAKIDYKKELQGEISLRDHLDKIPYNKICFSNSVDTHVKSTLKFLNLDGCFDYVVCANIYSDEIICKPMEESYTQVEKLIGIENRKNIIFFDDMLKNIEQARKRGWTTYHVQKENILKDILSEIIQEKENEERYLIGE
ncbi:Pyrimidine 5'-nucleotidase [Spraguea lophii 42_110]|uniref:Pyrimidine 5'-nucleotidase n=1 Tax=Spraguea lophii (strain 42_110) TaxID=1358809 RepID=S7W6Y1_SPRLO|nr:Pyrimidine 5'-nucleotidase [Spraguea lophii 42_110]